MEYYIFNSQESAMDFLNDVNNLEYFPIHTKPGKQKTLVWMHEPYELINNEWAVPRIQDNIMEALNISEELKLQFSEKHIQEIRVINQLQLKTDE